MNTIIFHTKMVDSLVEMLVETSDLSIFWWALQTDTLTCECTHRLRYILMCIALSCSFYSRAFEKMFQQCLELPSQSRHSICFPLLCTHFMSCTHELCPEEVNTPYTIIQIIIISNSCNKKIFSLQPWRTRNQKIYYSIFNQISVFSD